MRGATASSAGRSSEIVTSSSGADRGASARVEQALAERRADVEVDDEEVLLELARPGHEKALFVEDERPAVEHQLVLPADEIRVDDRHRRVGRPRREHRLAFGEAARVVRRAVEVDDHLCATGGLGEDRAGRAPRVLADRDADADAGDDVEGARIRARCEVALVVEHRVVRQELLAVHTVHAAVRAHGRRVVQVAPRLREADDRRAASGARRELVERFSGLGDERGAEQEVLRRIAGDRQLRKDDEIGAGGLGGLVRLEDAVDVAREVTDDDVDLGGRDAETRHHPRIGRHFPATSGRRSGGSHRHRATLSSCAHDGHDVHPAGVARRARPIGRSAPRARPSRAGARSATVARRRAARRRAVGRRRDRGHHRVDVTVRRART